MTAQPMHQHESERVPRDAEGIAATLSGARRTEFYRELLAATPETGGLVPGSTASSRRPQPRSR
ncbi:hypothetical protein [Streptomyces yangpuensis]